MSDRLLPRVPAGWAAALVHALCAIGFAAASLAHAAPDPAARPPAAIGAIRGTIAVHGCSVDPKDLLVRARPVDYAPLPSPAPAPGSARSFVTHATPARFPDARDGDFVFAIHGLAAGVPYRVGVRLIGGSQARCPRIAWDADREPLVVAGESPLAFSAFAVPSELEVLGAAEGRDRATWVGGDAVDFVDPARATRQFRWRTSVPGATGGELQVSLVPFPRVGSRAGPCSQDGDAVIKRVAFAAAPGRWVSPDPIDFHALLYPVRTGAAAAGSPDAAVVDAATLARIELGRPLYVRVVPTNADGPICDPDVAGLPAEVRLARLLLAVLQTPASPQPRLEVAKVFYHPPAFDGSPTQNQICYRATRKHVIAGPVFPFGWSSWEMLAVTKVQYDSALNRYFVPDGARFCACTNCSDDGWFESFTDTFGALVTGLVDAVAKLVNSASELWQKIQDTAVAAAADGIKALGVPCDAKCEAALQTGLEIGLATMGVPPSLPNFDQLVDQGFDYLAAQAMSEVGVPSTIADYVNDELSAEAQKFMKESVASMKGTPYSIPKLPDWLVPDLHFDRAYLTLDLYGQGVADAQQFTARPALILNNDPIYAGVLAKLPRKIPAKSSGKPLQFPLVLEPNVAGLPPPPAGYDAYNQARVDKNNWLKLRYQNGCYHLYLTALVPDPADIFNVFAANFRADTLAPCGP